MSEPVQVFDFKPERNDPGSSLRIAIATFRVEFDALAKRVGIQVESGEKLKNAVMGVSRGAVMQLPSGSIVLIEELWKNQPLSVWTRPNDIVRSDVPVLIDEMKTSFRLAEGEIDWIPDAQETRASAEYFLKPFVPPAP